MPWGLVPPWTLSELDHERLYSRKRYCLRVMATTQVQVRIPEELVREIDRWISEGRFANRSEAVKTIVALYDERERTRRFYRTLLRRSDDVRKNPKSLVLLEEML